MQSLKCQCGRTELSQGAVCPFCKSTRPEPRLAVALPKAGTSAHADAIADRILGQIVPGIERVAR